MNLYLNKAPCPNLVNCICIKNLTFSFFCIILLLSKESSTGPWLREKGGNFSENSSLYSSAILKLRVLQNPSNTLSFNFLIYMILNSAFFVASINENKGRDIEQFKLMRLTEGWSKAEILSSEFLVPCTWS